MSLSLDQIIAGLGPFCGPVAMLFGWLWVKERSDHRKTLDAFDTLRLKLIAKAGVIDNA